MDYFVSIQSTGFVTYGEIHSVAAWNNSASLDAAGTFSFTMPASDPNAALLVHKRVAVCYAVFNNGVQYISSGIIDKIELVMDNAGNPTGVLNVSGSDRLRELAYRNVGLLAISDSGVTGPQDIIAYAPSGWSLAFSWPNTTVKPISMQFARESVLDAFGKLTSITGEHFIAGTGQEIIWLNSILSGPVRLQYGINPLAIEDEILYGAITSIRRTNDSTDSFIGRMYAFGSGVGSAQITLNGATLPAAYTAAGYALGSDTKGYYLEHTATWAAHGIEAVRSYNDQATPTALMESAYEEVKRALTQPQEYALSVVGLKSPFTLGYTVRVVAQQWIDGYHAVDIDADMTVLSIDNRLDSQGLRTIGLTCSTIDRPIISDTTVLVDKIAQITNAAAHDQPVSGASVTGSPAYLAGLGVSVATGKTLTLSSADNFTLTAPATGTLALMSVANTGDMKLGTAGNGYYVKEGSNATMGIVTLTSGTATINTTKVTANSRIMLTTQGGTLTNVGAPFVSARTPGTSFTITSMNLLDTSDVGWILFEPS